MEMKCLSLWSAVTYHRFPFRATAVMWARCIVQPRID
jgi:hypothetical protein